MRVLMASYKDQAGSGYHLTRALRSIGIEASIAVLHAHKNGYAYDYLMPPAKRDRYALAKRLTAGIDVLHYKGDYIPGINSLSLFEQSYCAKRVITVGGSGFRRKSDDSASAVGLQWHPISRYRSRVSAMSALTPDLMYDDDIHLIPHALPIQNRQPPRNRVPVIGHSPSNRGKKGTDTVFLPALRILKDLGYKFEERIIEGVDHATCMRMKAGCDIFFDQAEVKAYGMSAVEAMMAGIPVVTRMPLDVQAKDPMYGSFPGAFFADADAYQAAEAMAVIMDEGPAKASAKMLDWANDMHSYGSVAKRMLALYGGA